jgi:ketosteroid isomerase-like protein
MSMSAEDDVRRASDQNYAAMTRMVNGDSAALSAVWSHATTVSAMHPIGGRQIGWDAVRQSFEQVAGISSNANVALRDQVIQVVGDLAYEIGVEHGHVNIAGQQISLEHRVTNIYRREAGGWKVVHHHADVSPSMVDVLRRLQAKT